MRKTKIICTLGPAVDNEEALEKLVLNGMDGARFNFSHGTHESHLKQLNKLKRVREKLGRPVAAIMDTKGPEIRIKTFVNGSITLISDEEFILTTEDVEGDNHRVSITYDSLHEELIPGNRILIDDGLIELVVKKIQGKDIICEVKIGGILSDRKGINIPGVPSKLPFMTQGDIDDLRFAIEQEFDFVAASFVRSRKDIEEMRRVLEKYGGHDLRIISKIENQQGIDNLTQIIEASDAIMVARGDLGVEIPAYEVPVLQKEIISSTVSNGKPVIIATQMLDSMMRNPRATRAEVSDVANAVFDGASCVMLSGETASGKYPIEAIKTLVQTVAAAEKATNYWGRFSKTSSLACSTINDAISHSCCNTAMVLNTAAILTATTSGRTARMISKFRPACPIVAVTTSESVRRKLAISWGVYPFREDLVNSTDELFAQSINCALSEGMIKTGDTVVITAGVPIGKSGATNLIKAQIVGQEY